ncbi:CWF complex protein sap62 [Candidozyma auris]|uniref:U1-type domain-containing protein n=1 Tax=Candidozyma auris TaxID=498019 RepID=A0A2H0ZL29_CANAR|nr:hypothetical_protein [[Candida] auris]KNE00696.2 hypothetical protein QG37_02226 [[Candida] auris]PIS51335.1 hypothetical protein B9J08_002913 [[Candida] auris]PIS53322.1 hypothetical protein CJI97_002987 [[Candida] auris]QEO19963.1 hypothetical_protein [[Candida] auris]GBL50057.1 putative splicing factor 3a [[Candida] auris]
MDYSERVNSKKGAGGVADTAEANVQTKRRIKELLTSQVLDLDNDPYVFRNHLGALECRLCLTTHTNEASYISHLGGRKHALNLEKRRILDEKQNRQARGDGTALAMNNVQRRTWHSIGLPVFKTTKIRDQETLQMGILVQVQCPRIKVKEPFFRLMSCYELSEKNQNISKSYLARNKTDYEDDDDLDPSKWQYLVISAEPYDNITIAFPASQEIEKPSGTEQMSKCYWWYWDEDSKEFFLQFLFKSRDEKKRSK